MYTADNICRMTEFLIDNIFLQFEGCLFSQVIGIPMGTNERTVLHYWLTVSFTHMRMNFLDNMIRSVHSRLARSLNLRYIYIDDLIAFNNKTTGQHNSPPPHGRILNDEGNSASKASC